MSVFDYVFGDSSRRSPRDSDPTLLSATCERCAKPFVYRNRLSGKQRDSIEYEPLRKKLMIQDSSVEPVLCDGCFLDIMTHDTPAPMTAGLEGDNMPLTLRVQQEQGKEEPKPTLPLPQGMPLQQRG
jgi:hypothetical protein